MSDPFDNPEAPPASPFVPPSFGPPTEPVYAPTQQTPAYGPPGNPHLRRFGLDEHHRITLDERRQ